MNILAVIVFLLNFVVFWWIFHQILNNWRAAFLSASVLWVTLLVALTEILSLFQSIVFTTILAAWCLCLLIAVGLWVKLIRNPKQLLKSPDPSKIPRGEAYLLFGGVLIACIVGVVAWSAPPNTYDSLTYHMPRVMHWIQNQSLAFYPTHVLRQLYLNPGSEFIILQLQILSGSDHFANLVQ